MASKIIEFDVVFNSADQEEGIEIPLALNANGRSTMTVGFVDTGCGACLFSNEIGMDLGIDIESGNLPFSSPEQGALSQHMAIQLCSNSSASPLKPSYTLQNTQGSSETFSAALGSCESCDSV